MTLDHAADRHLLRGQLRARRRALPASQRIVAAERLATQLLALPFAPQTGYVAGYWAMDGEIALHVWQLNLPPDCIYCLPVLHEDGRLRFAPWRPGDTLVSNRYGIPEPDLAASSLLEPEALSMAVLPLVGFDTRGHRLGMGGGWYDRSFGFRKTLPAPPWLVGAAFDTQNVESRDDAEVARVVADQADFDHHPKLNHIGLTPADWDVPLDAVCTESTTHHCRTMPT